MLFMHGLAVDSLSMDLNEKLIILFALHELPEHPNTSILCMCLLLEHCTIVSSVGGPTTLQNLLLLVGNSIGSTAIHFCSVFRCGS